ncbi:MAG: pyruvate kinase [Candidatus Heimdallarchaeota archaeon]
MPKFTKSKIIATIGPATGKRKVLKSIIEAGVDVCRLNFSHGTHDVHAATYELIREANDEVAILADLSGPKIRIGEVKDGVVLQRGDEFILSADYDIIGTNKKVGVNYPKLPSEVKKGDKIFIADGMLKLEVTSSNEQEAASKILEGGKLTSRKGVNVPGAQISLYAPTEKDLKDIEFCTKLGVDYFAASFVRRPDDIAKIREATARQSSQVIEIKGYAPIDLGSKRIPIISKIEHGDALDTYDEILNVTDGVMIARGDLGIEISPEKVPIIQKDLVERANRAGIISVVATEMLESMTYNPRPTRAEASDVANAILDGADAVMLSGETAMGKYPVKTVEYMDQIILTAEKIVRGRERERKVEPSRSEAIAYAACRAAEIVNAKTILAVTRSGGTPKIISKYRPTQHLVVATPYANVVRELQVVWGVASITMPVSRTTDEMIYSAVVAARERGLIDEIEEIVVVLGTLLGFPDRTNTVQVLSVFDVLASAPLFEAEEHD